MGRLAEYAAYRAAGLSDGHCHRHRGGGHPHHMGQHRPRHAQGAGPGVACGIQPHLPHLHHNYPGHARGYPAVDYVLRYLRIVQQRPDGGDAGLWPQLRRVRVGNFPQRHHVGGKGPDGGGPQPWAELFADHVAHHRAAGAQKRAADAGQRIYCAA